METAEDPTRIPDETDVPLPPPSTPEPAVAADDDELGITVAAELPPVPADPPTSEDIVGYLQIASLKTLNDLRTTRMLAMGIDDYTAQEQIPGTYENVLANFIVDFSVEADRVAEAVQQITDKSQFAADLRHDGKRILRSGIKLQPGKATGQVISGMNSRLTFAAASGQLRRVPLYNSGFYIDLEAADLTALNAYYTKALDNTNTYEREFGYLYYYYNDLLIKQAVVELFQPLIMRSTLRGWDRGTTLLQSIKLVDLKVILHNLAIMMFPDGFPYRHICTNPRSENPCRHTDEQTIDLNLLLRHDFLKIPSDGHVHMQQFDGDITIDKLEAYQTGLGFTRTVRIDDLEFELQVPSIAAYLDYGTTFNAQLKERVFASNVADVYNELNFSYYKIYTPYVKRLTLYDKLGGVIGITEAPADIAHQLSRRQTYEKDRDAVFQKAIDQFIAETEISHICYPAAPCPQCGYKDPRDYFSVDPQHTFFMQSAKRLYPT